MPMPLSLFLLAALAEPGPLRLPPYADSPAPLSEALRHRRTDRNLAGPSLSLAEVAQLAWAAQGENRPGKRTVASARARYPLTLYAILEGHPSLPAGVYRYLPKEHALVKLSEQAPSALLGAVKGMQPWIAKSPAVFLMAGSPERLGPGSFAETYTAWEAGAASQSLLLQATAMGLGTGVASGIDLEAIGKALPLPKGEKAIIVLPVGRTR